MCKRLYKSDLNKKTIFPLIFNKKNRFEPPKMLVLWKFGLDIKSEIIYLTLQKRTIVNIQSITRE